MKLLKNFLLKSIAALLVVIMMMPMLCNLSYATTVSQNDLKSVLEKYMSQKLYIKDSYDGRSTTETMGQYKIDDSKMEFEQQGTKLCVIDYSIEDNKIIFTSNYDGIYEMLKTSEGVDIDKASDYDKAMYLLLLLIVDSDNMSRAFLASAETLGIDPSLAYTYFSQQCEELSNSDQVVLNKIENQIFSWEFNTNSDKNILYGSTLTVNLDELANLNNSKINSSKTTFRVFVGELPDSEKEDISKEYNIDSIKDKTYTGKLIKPAIKLIEKEYGWESYLRENDDYIVSFKNNLEIGKATVTVTGTGFYKGKLTKTFYIVPAKVTGVTNKKQDTKSITVKWDKVKEATGYVLEKYDTKKKAYKKVIDLKETSYKVTGLKAGTTYKFRVKAYKTVDGKKYYGAYSKTAKLTTSTSAPTLLRVTAGSKRATVSWKKVSEASGYEVYMSTKKGSGYNKIKTVTSNKTVKYTKTKLTKKKTYYFKVRTYRTVDGKKVYSSYSNIKSIKVK